MTYFAYIYDSLRGKHDCLVPVTPYLAGVFNYLRLNRKIPPKGQALDMLHILLLLQFHLDGLLADEVLEHNRAHLFDPALDPSSELIGITLAFIPLYHLFRRRYSPKDEVDIQVLAALSERCGHIQHTLHLLNPKHIHHILHIVGTCENVR